MLFVVVRWEYIQSILVTSMKNLTSIGKEIFFHLLCLLFIKAHFIANLMHCFSSKVNYFANALVILQNHSMIVWNNQSELAKDIIAFYVL